MRDIILIAHNLRSCHNVGSLLRTAEGLGVREVILGGYTPYPLTTKPEKMSVGVSGGTVHADYRLPHESAKLHKQIQKTALGAETSQPWRHADDIVPVLEALRQEGYRLAAVEQSADSVGLPDFQAPEKLALLVGREVEGVEPEILALMDDVVEIPMFGSKESFNVVQAAAMALYHCRFQA